MGKLTEAITAEIRASGGVCTVPAFLAGLPKDVRADLDAAFNAGVPVAAIVRALNKIGHQIGSDTLRRHRNGDCKCDGSAD